MHTNKYMLVSFNDSTQTITTISFFDKGTATLMDGVTITVSDVAQVLFKMTKDTYTLTMRDPILSSPRSIQLEIEGLTDMQNLQHWCKNAGVVDSTRLVVEESFTGPSLCQVQITRQTPQSPGVNPIPPVNPPSPTPPPYIPPFPSMDDLAYDNSTNVIVIPDNQAMKTAKIAIISSSIIIIMIVIIVLLVIFLLRCKKTART